VEVAPGTAWTTAVVAFLLAMPLWRFSMHAITVAHEGGHALIGMLLGGKVSKVEIGSVGGGGTYISIAGLPRVFELLAGYLGPSIVGFTGVLMIIRDVSPRTILMLSLVFTIFVLVLVRDFFSFVVAGGTVALLWVLVTRAEPSVQLGFAYVWVWFMLMGSSRKIPDLFWGMTKQKGTSDAEKLGKLTHVTDLFWLFLFWLGSVGALVYGGALLLRHTG